MTETLARHIENAIRSLEVAEDREERKPCNQLALKALQAARAKLHGNPGLATLREVVLLLGQASLAIDAASAPAKHLDS